MANLLDQLAAMTVVVADTGDIDAIKQFTPRDATTNPSLILAAAQIPTYQDLIDRSLKESREVMGADASAEQVVREALDEICVTFGREILKIVPGRVSTEVDARLSYNTEATIAKARKLIGLYRMAGIGTDRVLIKIASTWEGIKAAEKLEREGIHCNLTLLFGRMVLGDGAPAAGGEGAGGREAGAGGGTCEGSAASKEGSQSGHGAPKLALR